MKYLVSRFPHYGHGATMKFTIHCTQCHTYFPILQRYNASTQTTFCQCGTQHRINDSEAAAIARLRRAQHSSHDSARIVIRERKETVEACISNLRSRLRSVSDPQPQQSHIAHLRQEANNLLFRAAELEAKLLTDREAQHTLQSDLRAYQAELQLLQFYRSYCQRCKKLGIKPVSIRQILSREQFWKETNSRIAEIRSR